MTRAARDRRALRILVLSGLAFAALALAVVSWEAVDRLDVRFVTWVHGAAPDELVEVMRVLTYAGSVVVLGPIALGAALLLVRGGRQLAAAYVLAAFVVGQLVTQLLKLAFQRGRPELDDPYVQLSTYAFPSGHALGATATYGAIVVVLSMLASGRRSLVGAGLALLILVVAASRVLLGAHYVLDTAGGVLAGIAVLSGLVLAFDAAPRHRARLALLGRNEQAQGTTLDP
jgi:membrane-associated phospholipid phosphatase